MKQIDVIYYGLRDEVKAKNPALAELITQAAASFEVKANMCEAALKGELTADNFKEKHGKLLPESHKNEPVQESAPLGLTNIDEAKRDYAVLFGVEPKTTTTKKEGAAPIKKNNGASQNFVEGSPFNGDRSTATAENNPSKDVVAKSDKALADGLLKVGAITEAEHKKLTGNGKPDGYEKLTEAQRKEFDFARAVGISEADAFRLLAITGNTFKEVSR